MDLDDINKLPEWVLALVFRVMEYEDEHPAPDREEHYLCLGDALDAVPAEVQSYVEGWKRGGGRMAMGDGYVRHAETVGDLRSSDEALASFEWSEG